jgi:cation transporter-like permease
VDLAELPLGSLVEIKTENSTYWLTTLSTTIFSAGFAVGLVIASSRADSWGNPCAVNTPQIIELGDLLSIVNSSEDIATTTSRITSLKVIQ